MFDIEAKRVTSPIYNLLVYLNEYDEDRLEDKDIQLLFSNIENHVRKLIYSVALINKFQSDEQFIKTYNRTEIVSIQLVEYCFYKISTIFDISYQIADTLIFPKKKTIPNKKTPPNKYEYLAEQFKVYSDQLPDLETKWYESFNKIRNRITHGGIKINTFYINNDNVKNRICFQAYDFDLDDLVDSNPYYSNIYNNNINFADNFFAYFTHLLYVYLLDFFTFILLELTKDKKINLNEIKLSNDFLGQFERSHKTWLLSDINTFTEITNNMIILKRVNGHMHAVSTIQKNQKDIIIAQAYEKFPFTFMRNITEGDWIVEK